MNLLKARHPSASWQEPTQVSLVLQILFFLNPGNQIIKKKKKKANTNKFKFIEHTEIETQRVDLPVYEKKDLKFLYNALAGV